MRTFFLTTTSLSHSVSLFPALLPPSLSFFLLHSNFFFIFQIDRWRKRCLACDCFGQQSETQEGPSSHCGRSSLHFPPSFTSFLSHYSLMTLFFYTDSPSLSLHPSLHNFFPTSLLYFLRYTFIFPFYSCLFSFSIPLFLFFIFFQISLPFLHLFSFSFSSSAPCSHRSPLS